MKLKFSFLFACIFIACFSGYAQEEPTTLTPEAVNATPAKIAPAKPKAMPAQDSIKGNAGKDVAIVSAPGSCTGKSKPVGITNKTTTGRNVIVRIETTTIYNGHISKKLSNLDNLGPAEVRFIGCNGCIENPSGQTCTTYKIIAAMYK